MGNARADYGDVVHALESLSSVQNTAVGPEQISPWTLGYLSRSRLGFSECQVLSELSVWLPTLFYTVNFLGPHTHGFECYAVRTDASKTFWFFPVQTQSSYDTFIPITEPSCRTLVETLIDPEGVHLQQLRWDLYGTSKHTDCEFEWPTTTTSSVINYYIKHVNISTTLDNIGLMVPTVHFSQPCTIYDMKCPTINKGHLVWYSYHKNQSGLSCAHRFETFHFCNLSPTSLRCPHLPIHIVSVSAPPSCSLFSKLIRLGISRSFTFYPDLLTLPSNQINTDFDLIFNLTQAFPNVPLYLTVYQINTC